MRSSNTTAGGPKCDEALVLDTATGRLLDFTEVPDAVKRDTSSRGIAPLASDPYAAALAAQHRLHVYRRYIGDPEWAAFFAGMTATRDSCLRAASVESLDELLSDYRLLRAGDLASLAFCNEWADTADDGCGGLDALRWDDADNQSGSIGRSHHRYQHPAGVIRNERFGVPAEARRAVATAQVITVTGVVRGAERETP